MEPNVDKKKAGRPKSLDPNISKGSRSGLTPEYTRKTVILREAHLQEIERLSKENNLPAKHVLEILLGAALEDKKIQDKIKKKGFKSEEFFTVEELSLVLHSHPITIRNYINSGKIPAQKIGREWFIEISPKTREIVDDLKKHHPGDLQEIANRSLKDPERIKQTIRETLKVISRNVETMTPKLEKLYGIKMSGDEIEPSISIVDAGKLVLSEQLIAKAGIKTKDYQHAIVRVSRQDRNAIWIEFRKTPVTRRSIPLLPVEHTDSCLSLDAADFLKGHGFDLERIKGEYQVTHAPVNPANIRGMRGWFVFIAASSQNTKA